MIIELVSSTVFTSIVEKQPLPIDEFKPHLYKTIRLLINEKRALKLFFIMYLRIAHNLLNFF